MKRILLIASILGASTLTSAAFGYNVYRSIPEVNDAAAAPQQGAAPAVYDGSYEIGSFEEPEEGEKLFSGSIVGSWSDGFTHDGNVWNMNQVWLSSGHEVSGDPGRLDFGYQVDALFGTNILQSSDGFDGKWGVSDDGYGASLYQAYGQIGWGKLSLKAGKFGTIVGYESVDYSANDLVTHTYMFDHEPATHTGGIFTLQANEAFSVDVGLVSGLDNSFDNRRGDTGFLFGANLQLAENFSLSYASELSQVHSALGEDRLGTAFGYYDIGGVSIGDSDEYLQTVTANIDFTDKFSYAFTTNYGCMADRATHDARYNQFGFANYFSYALTDQLKAAARYEYYQQQLDEAGKAAGTLGDVKQYAHDVSFALIYKPIEYLFVQPEVRYDWLNTENAGVKTEENGVTGAVACGFTF